MYPQKAWYDRKDFRGFLLGGAGICRYGLRRHVHRGGGRDPDAGQRNEHDALHEERQGHARNNHYKIVDAPNGITGTFGLAPDWPQSWAVAYASDRKSVYVYHPNGTQIILK